MSKISRNNNVLEKMILNIFHRATIALLLVLSIGRVISKNVRHC